MCLIRCCILRFKKLHVSASSGHHQVLSFDSLKIILYNSRGGVFDEEISTPKPLLEHSTSILGVWVNHVIIHKSITLYCQNKNKNKKHEGPVLGKPLVISSKGPGLIACRYLHLSGVVSVDGLCVTWVDLVIASGGWREKSV